MRIKHLSIQNFKSLRQLELNFTDPRDRPQPLTCLVGDNGSGKTTVLQAIAFVLSQATRRTRLAREFDWHGFVLQRLASLGPTRIELAIEFSDDELALTTQLFQKWYDARSAHWRGDQPIAPPSDHAVVHLVYEQNRITAREGDGALNQFLGRYFVKGLSESDPSLRSYFSQLGDVFWFDQHRNLGSPSARRHAPQENGEQRQESWAAGVEQLRQYLVGWWGYHKSANRSNGRDYIPELQSRFERVFPGRRFIGLQPRDDDASMSAKDFYFLLQSEDAVYDLAEMSSGEQAVFPLIYEFVRLDIGNAIVLIDELELHLHPPEQQRLLFALPHLGEHCQFIISTHSPYLTDVIPNEQEVRLEGGQRCL